MIVHNKKNYFLV